MGDATELERDRAFRQGVEETSDTPVLYIDPDQFDPENWVASGQTLVRQLEAQVPGSAEALQTKIEQRANAEYGIDYVQVPMSEIAQMLYNRGPAALPDIEVNAVEHCVVNQPHSFINEAIEFATILSVHDDERLQANIQGTDVDYNLYMGRHEGEHCNIPEQNEVEPDSDIETAQGLDEEARADRSALEVFDVAFLQEIEDLRSLAVGAELAIVNGEHMDPRYATGIFLDEDSLSTEYHVNAAETLRANMDRFVDDAIATGMYAGVGSNASEVFEQNPDAYFSIVTARLDADRALAIQVQNQNPSFENAEPIISNLIQSEYAQSYEDAYRRRILGQDVPDREPVRFPEFEEAFYAEYERRQQAEPAYEPEPICSEQATVISANGLNMRQSPDQFSELVARGDEGTPSAQSFGSALTLYDSESSPLGGVWREAVTPEGRIGWVSERYLDVGPETCQPVAMLTP